MEDICPICHLPKSICTCGARAKEKEKIEIKVERKKFKKYMTVIIGFKSQNEGKEIEKYLKRKLACGGTFKNNVIEIQGNQKEKVRKLLIDKGYLEALSDA